MRLAIGRAARYGGADARRYRRIEKIDIEADMQHAVACFYPLDDAPDQDADPEFIDRAHVGDRDAAIADQVFFKRIDRPDSEQIELIGTNGCAWMVAEQAVKAGLAAQERSRHAMHVAGDSGRRRVVVGVSV